MPDTGTALAAIAVLTAVVYGTRVAGYLIGSRVVQGSAVALLLETLPGAALASLVAASAVHGSLVDLAGFLLTAVLFYRTGRSLPALIAGLCVTVAGAHLLAA